jgi:PAS domain S-box-containing protein
VGAGDNRVWAERIERALGSLFVETAVPIIVVGPDGRFAAANGAAIRQYGYTLDELLEKRIHDLIADGRPDTSIDADLHRVTFGKHASLERRPHKRKDGTVLWVVPNAGPQTIDGRRFVVSVLTDVTAFVDADARARAAVDGSLRDRQVVLSAITDLIAEREVEPALSALARAEARALGGRAAVWLPETEGSNRLRLVASHGVAAAEAALGELYIDWVRDSAAARARATRAAVNVDLDDPIDGGMARRLADVLPGRCILSPLLGRTGAYGLLSSHVEPLGDEYRALAVATTLGGFGGMILESVQLERRAETVWKAASERLTDGIALLDRDLRIVRMNSVEALLLPEGAGALGRRCTEVFPTCIGHDPCPHQVALSERLHLVRELSGPEHPYRMEIIPASPNDAEIAVIHVVHDLSDERAMRTRLLAADRLATIGRLSAGVAHEINNPAAFVTVNLGVLRDRFLAGTAQSSDVLAMLEDSLNGMDRIREIVRDLKGFARERSRDVVDLSQVATSALRIAAHETRGRARVDRMLDDGVLTHVRGARMAQCVLNLVVNAAQAIPAGDPQDHRIEVRTYRSGDRVRLEVTDTGPGVPDAHKRKIFEPFFTTREATGGTGLGLWLARGIVEEEDGSLDVEDAPGGGARFVVDLPAHAVEAAAPVAPQTR